MKRIREILFIVLCYGVLAYISYGSLPQTFFLQDEWALFSTFNYWIKAPLSWFERLFLYEQYTHVIPLSNIVSFIEFKLFGASFAPYALVSMGLHLINSMLVFLLAKKLLKHNIAAFVAGLLFATYSNSHQAITWVATTMGTAGSTLFVLISLFLFVNYIEEAPRRRFAIMSLVALVVSLTFKESSVFLFLFLPIMGFVLAGREWKKLSHFFLYLFLMLVGFIGVRSIFLHMSPVPASVASEILPPTLFQYGFRAIALPIRFLAQSFIPASGIIWASKRLLMLGYPQFVQNPFIMESVGADIISFVAALFLICLGAYLYSLKNKKIHSLSRVIVLSLIGIGITSLPLMFVLGKAGFLSLIDGRHLYGAGIFTSLVLSAWIVTLYTLVRKYVSFRIIVIALLVAYVLFHISSVRRDINALVRIAVMRKSILATITSSVPTLPKQVVFYVESDSAYYGIPERIVPFQSGFGQVLIAWYNGRGASLPACFFKEKYLYDLISEGYRECNGRGFGFFRTREGLKNALLQYQVHSENVKAFSYHSSSNKILPLKVRFIPNASFTDGTLEISDK